jgi:hypothetical protein
MSERALDKNQEASAAGQFDLTDLHASKDLHIKEERHAANTTDLSSASISATNIVRATPKAEPRRDPIPSPSVSHTSQATERQGVRNHAAQPPGIFKNPTYRYSGNIIQRIITFVANILKVLERLLLRLLGARDLNSPTPPPRQANAKTNASPTDPKTKGKKDPNGWINTTSRS